MKKKKIGYSIFLTIVTFFVAAIAYVFVTATIKNIIVSEQVKDFIGQGVYEGEYGTDTKLYAVYTDELEDEVYNIAMDKIVLGNNGDYFVMPITRAGGFDFADQMMSYLFGGHAGITGYLSPDEPVIVEAMGIDDASVVLSTHPLDIDLYKPELRSVIGMRTKCSKEEREKAFEYGLDIVGSGYNYSFVFDIDGLYYCTTVLTRAYDKHNDMNYDLGDGNPLYVSTQDIVCSSDSYITFFKYIDKDGIINVYYLKKR